MTEAGFLWGAPADIGRVASVAPTFRLVRENAALPAVAQPFAVPAGAKPIVRGDRAVAQTWSTDEADFCFVAGLLPPDLSAPRAAQAAAIFPALADVLAEAGMTFAQVVRTWLYIDRVCEWYDVFNAARSEFFEKNRVFETFLPASTGIGSANLDGAAITAGAIAMRPHQALARAEIVESPLQVAAMAYKSSFSRAAEIILPTRRQLFVSGTASIRPNSHEVAYVGDVPRQIDCVMTAVHAILDSRGYGWKDVSRAIAYLKDPSSRPAWQDWLRAHGLPPAFAAETVCDVCRDEWLFEIEVDAVSGARII